MPSRNNNSVPCLSFNQFHTFKLHPNIVCRGNQAEITLWLKMTKKSMKMHSNHGPWQLTTAAAYLQKHEALGCHQSMYPSGPFVSRISFKRVMYMLGLFATGMGG